MKQRVLALGLLAGMLPTMAFSATYRAATADELHIGYCLAYIKASGPTEADLNDPSIKDALTQNVLAQRQRVIDRLEAYLEPRRAVIDPAEVGEESKKAEADWAYVNTPRVVDPSQVTNDPVTKRVLSCASELTTVQ